MILPDYKVAERVLTEDMIKGYVSDKTSVFEGEKLPSFGQGGHSYDPRSTGEFLIGKTGKRTVDPKNIDLSHYDRFKIRTDRKGSRYIDIPPKKFALTYTREYFKIPDDIAVKVMSKSTYARLGLAVETTFVDPSFEGQVVLELYNRNDAPVRIYIDGGVVQFIFEKTLPAKTSYADSKGKYMKQTGLTLGRV